MIERATIYDLNDIVKIHMHEFAGDFLPSLGEDFLKHLYNDYLNEKEAILLVSRNHKVKGFILGVVNFPVLFKKIIIRSFFTYSFLLIKASMKKPALIKKILSSLFYTKKTAKFNIPAELVVISVAKRYQNNKIGSSLVKQLEIEFKKRNIKTYKVSTTKTNNISNIFYTKNNFKLINSFFFYNENWNLYSKKL